MKNWKVSKGALLSNRKRYDPRGGTGGDEDVVESGHAIKTGRRRGRLVKKGGKEDQGVDRSVVFFSSDQEGKSTAGGSRNWQGPSVMGGVLSKKNRTRYALGST